jgi:flagellar hook-associated protein 2
MAGVTISGAASGLDTASIINSLVQVQANQQSLLKNKQSGYQKTADAYTALMSSLASLATQASSLADTASWKGMTATSSSSSVTATATGTSSGSFTFDVTSVAARHALVSAGSVASTAVNVASTGSLTLTKSDGTTTTIDAGSGSLDEVVTAINTAKAGITASAVQVAPGEFRLQVSSQSSGSASTFTLDGLDGFTGTNVLAQGADATIHVGDATTGYDITSASNTFADVVPGLSFTVSRVETGVTVSSSPDGTAVADSVQSLVDAANKILDTVATQSTWDATKKTGGPLLGQAAVRNLTQSILSTVGSAGAAGLSLTREGRLAFDKTAFTDAYATDPAAVAAQFGASVSFAKGGGVTGNITLVRAGDTAKAGTYDVTVTQAATAEQWSVAAAGTLEGRTLSLARAGGSTFSYTAEVGEPIETSLRNINARLSAAGFGVGAAVSGGNVVLTAASTGAGAAFTAALDGVTQTQVTAGQDVAGTIDGLAASGSGSVLSLTSGTSGAKGLSLNVGVTAADVATSGGAVGQVTYSQGLGQRLASLLTATTGTDGTLATAKTGSDAQVKDLQEQIDKWDSRLETYRTMLQAQFTAMETAIQRLKSASSALASFTSTSSSSSTTSSSSTGG